MFRIKFSLASRYWKTGGDEGKVIEYEGKTYPYNERLEKFLRYFRVELAEDLTFGQDTPPVFIDLEEIRGTVEL